MDNKTDCRTVKPEESANSRDGLIKVTSIVLNKFKNDSRVIKTCRSLVNSGYETRVIALHDDSLPEFEIMEGFSVHRVRLTTIHWPRKKIVQAIKYLEFSFRVLIRYRGHDIYHCNDLHTLPVGVLIKWLSKKEVRLVYDAHEYETETDDVNALEKFFRKQMERFLVRFADKMITVSDSIASEYARLYGIDKPAIVLNTPLFSNVIKSDNLRRDLEVPANQTIFLYQGGLAHGRGIDVLLNAFDSADMADKAIVFMGYGPMEPEIKAKAQKCNNIYFREAVAPAEVILHTSSADVGISTIENTCLSYYYCLPNKLFEYAMAEIPVIVSNLAEMKKIVNQYGLGVVAQENSVVGIRQAINEMQNFDLEKFVENVKEFKSVYNWETQEQSLLKIYSSL